MKAIIIVDRKSCGRTTVSAPRANAAAQKSHGAKQEERPFLRRSCHAHNIIRMVLRSSHQLLLGGISLLHHEERGCHVANRGQRLSRDLIYGIRQLMMIGVIQINDVDHAQPGIEQWDMVVNDRVSDLRDEGIGIAEVTRSLPNARHDLGSALHRVPLLINLLQTRYHRSCPSNAAEDRFVMPRWRMLREIR